MRPMRRDVFGLTRGTVLCVQLPCSWQCSIEQTSFSYEGAQLLMAAMFPAGPLFGCSSASMMQQPISQFLNLGPKGVEFLLVGDDNNRKAGGMKLSARPQAGVPMAPRVVEAVHTDGGSLSCLVQVGGCLLQCMHALCCSTSLLHLLHACSSALAPKYPANQYP
jgi:hypothetical protein